MLRRLISVLVVLVPMGLWTAAPAAMAAGDANQASCPSSLEGLGEVSPGFRSYLPDCRAYELVTPPNTGGQPAFGNHFQQPQMSADGAHLLGIDFAGFAGTENEEQTGYEYGATYEFSRTSSGWVTESLEPPASLAARRNFVTGSADLSRSLWELVVQSKEGEELPGERPATEGYTYAVRERTPGGQVRFAQVGPDSPAAPKYDRGILGFEGASGDLTHILLTLLPDPYSGAEQFWPGDKTREGDQSLYEYVGTGNTEPTLVGVENSGAPPWEVGATHVNEGAKLVSECGTHLGSAGEEGSAYNAVSTDGAIVYFTALACEGTPEVNELWARIDGSQSVDISEPTTGPTGDCELCNESKPEGALFQGASQDGTKVFFLSEQELLSGAKGQNLYEYDFHATKGKRLMLVAPEVAGLARISEDGSHVYFVANGVLAGANHEGKSPAVGGGKERNLYVLDTSANNSTIFVATLQTEAEEEATLTACESAKERGSCEETVKSADIWGREDHRFAQATPDGRYLVFPSLAHLTGSEDTSTVPQIFEYDAHAESLARVSIGQKSSAFPEGYNENGNTGNLEDAPRIFGEDRVNYGYYMDPPAATSGLALSEDGRVFFTSQDRLTPLAAEGREHTEGALGRAGLENVYEYRENNVYLISPGDEAEPLVGLEGRLLGTDESGGDVFFSTTDSLVPQDTNTQASWYDARVGGGFPAPVSPAGCAGEACRGSLSAPPFLPSAGGSETTAGGGNLPPTVSKPAVKPKSLTRAQKLARALRACKKKPKRKRRSCKSQARKRYGPTSKASKNDRSGK